MYTITATKFDEPRNNVLGMASINYGDMFQINSIRIMQSKQGNVFVSMPQRKINRIDSEKNLPTYEDICCPITKEFREELYNKILEAFDNGETVIGEPQLTEPAKYNLTITPYKEMHNYQAGKASLYLDDRFVLNNIKLIVNKNGDFNIGMPSVKSNNTDNQGKDKWNAIFFPRTKSFAAQFYADVKELAKEKINLEALIAQNKQTKQNAREAAEENQDAVNKSNQTTIPETKQNLPRSQRK